MISCPRGKRLLMLLTVPLLVCPAPAYAGTAEGVVRQAVTLFADWSDSGSSKSLQALSGLIDFEHMSRESLGEGQWINLTQMQRERFSQTFRRLVEGRYYPRWRKTFGKGRLDIRGRIAENGFVVVNSTLSMDKRVHAVSWRLKRNGDDFAIVDVASGKKDLVVRLRDRFAKLIKKDGVGGIMAWMRKHQAKVPVGPEVSESLVE